MGLERMSVDARTLVGGALQGGERRVLALMDQMGLWGVLNGRERREVGKEKESRSYEEGVA